MSFGFGVGDFLAVGKLAFNLYKDCYLIAKGAPQEFKLLVDELKTLHATMLLFSEEFKDPTSVLVRSGEDRKKMLKEMLDNVQKTLDALNEAFRKHRNLGSTTRSGLKKGWDKFKWSLDARDIDGLRSKLTYHNGILSLLLTCAGNSSLQRLEAVTQSISAGVDELKQFLRRAETGKLDNRPPVTGPHSTAGIIFIEKCMQAAEVLQRWTAVGIEDWIKAGRWWLLQASMSLHGLTASANLVDSPLRQAYINLLKASWILTDMISSHPQLSYIELPIRVEIMRLTEAINMEFRRLQKLDIKFPTITIDDCIIIWEGHAQTPALRPVSGNPSANEAFPDAGAAWELSDTHILYQGFAQYQAADNNTEIRVLVLVLLDKDSMCPRLVLHDQGWRCLLELRLRDGELSSDSALQMHISTVKVLSHRLNTSTNIDAEHLHIILTFCAQYGNIIYDNQFENLFRCFSTHKAFILLTALRMIKLTALRAIIDFPQYKPERNHDIHEHDQGHLFLAGVLTVVSQILRTTVTDSELQTYPKASWFAWMLQNKLLLDLGRELLIARGIPAEIATFWMSPIFSSPSLYLDICRPDYKNQVSDMSYIFHWLADTTSHYTQQKLCHDRSLLFWALRTDIIENVKLIFDYLDEQNKPRAMPDLDDTYNYNILESRLSPLYNLILNKVNVASCLVELQDSSATKNLSKRSSYHHQVLAHILQARPHVLQFLDNLGRNKTGGRDQVKVPSIRVAIANGFLNLVLLLSQYAHDVADEYNFRANLDSTYRSNSIRTLIHMAIRQRSDQAIIRLMLERGISVGTYDHWGNTPLMLVVTQKGQESLAKLLLDFRASDHESRFRSTGSLHLAVKTKCNEAMLRVLLDHECRMSLDPWDENDNTPLHLAAKAGNDSSVKLLLEHGAPHNVRARDGETPLHTAVTTAGNDATLKVLLEHGARHDVKDRDGSTPLHLAVTKAGNDATVKVLLEHGARHDVEGKYFYPPLHWAVVTAGNDGTVKLLLEHGARHDVKVENDATPLHLAVTTAGNDATVKVLLEHGARHDAELKGGSAPLHLAVMEAGNDATVKVLLEHGARHDAELQDGSTPLHLAVTKAGNDATVKVLLEHGARHDVKNHAQRTPLHLAVAKPGTDAIVKLLLEHGARHDVKDRDGETPLHLAVAKPGTDTIVKLLLEHGARHDVKDRDGETPLHLAVMEAGNDATVKLLLEYEADVAAKAANERSPLDIAESVRNSKIKELLMKYVKSPVV